MAGVVGTLLIGVPTPVSSIGESVGTGRAGPTAALAG